MGLLNYWVHVFMSFYSAIVLRPWKRLMNWILSGEAYQTLAIINIVVQLTGILLYMVRATLDIQDPHVQPYCGEEAKTNMKQLHY